MRIRIKDVKHMLLVSLLSAPAIAFMAFDFVFPNISTPSLDKNMLGAFLLSVLIGMPSGYFLKRTDFAILTVFLYVFIGYGIAILAYSAPFVFYDFSVMFPGLYFLFFLNRTVIIVMLFVLGGFVGAVFGQQVQESVETGETPQWFSGPPP
jgi:hypothetical protein